MAQKNTNAFKKLMEISSGWAVDPYRCPECGFELECYDGDNLEAMEQDFDDFRETLSIDASLLDFRCNQCSERYFLVMLSVIQATGLSDAWVNKYFWQNERQEEEERNITVDWQESMKPFTVALVGGSNLWKCKKRKKKEGNKRPEKGERHGTGLFVNESPCHPTGK